MAVRRDTYQLDIQVITENSRQYAQLIKDNKTLIKDFKKAKLNGEGLEKTIKDITDSAKKIDKINLKNVLPNDLVTRAHQLRSILNRIPQSRPEYKLLEKQYIAINQELGEMRRRSRGVAAAKTRMAREGFSAGRLIARGLALFSFAQVGRDVVSTTAKFEKFEAVLENALGSQSAAQASFQMIQDFAASTPFQVDQIIDSYIKLVNRGFKPTQEELIKIGDLTASQGKEYGQLVEAILDAQTGEFERLKEFGIQASKAGDQVTLSFKDQQVEVKNTEEAIRNAIIAFGDLEGVQGTTAKIADTLEGKLSNFQDRITKLMNTLGESGFGAAVGGAIDLLGKLSDEASFALGSASQKAAALTSEFESQKNEVNKLERELNPLLERYDQLTEKTELSETEQKELEKVIKQIGEAAPNAVTEIDNYGNALSINAGKAREFVKAQKTLLQGLNRDAISEIEEQLKSVTSLRDIEKRLAETGETGGIISVGISDSRRKEAFAETQRLTEEIEFLELRLKQLKGEPLVEGLNGNPQTPPGGDDGNKPKSPTKDKVDELEELTNQLLEQNTQLEKAQEGEANRLDAELDAIVEKSLAETQADMDSIERKKALSEEIRLLGLSDRERELEEIDNKYAKLKELAELYGLDVTNIEKKWAKERSAIEEDLANKKIAESKRAADYEKNVERAKRQIARDSLQLVVSLLSKDEEARKKNAKAIKAFTVFQIQVDLAAEIQKIWRNSASFGPLAQVIGSVQTALAVGRSVAQIRNVQSQKFARGGFTGSGLFKDETGQRVAGWVHQDEYVAPTWQIKKHPGLFAQLENDRLRGYNTGGFANINTTPSAATFTQSITNNTEVDFTDVLKELRLMRREAATKKPVEAFVVLDKLNAAQAEYSSVRDEASI